MGEAVATLFIVIAVMSVSILLFGGWLAVVTVKGMGKLLGGLMMGQGALSRGSSADEAVCGRCRGTNPASARFCRRCGATIV